MKFLMSHSVCLMQRRDVFFGGGWRYPCNLFGAQLARQFIKINSLICLTYHLSDNLKISHKCCPTTYTNQTFCFHLCCIHSSCPYDPLNKIMCFALVDFTYAFRKDSITEYFVGCAWETHWQTMVFLYWWNLEMQNRIQLAHLEL